MNGLSVASISPYYCCSSCNVDVERLECVVHYGNGISRTSTFDDVRKELEDWSDGENNKSNCYDNLAYTVLRKRGVRPNNGASSMVILVLA